LGGNGAPSKAHLILDNYGTHKTKAMQNWLKRHKRFKMHFIPTSSSWLNLVERFFAEITGKKIRRLDKDSQGHSGKTCPRPGQAADCQNREPSVRFGTLGSFWNGLDKAEMSEPLRLIFRLALLTGQHRSEVVGMRKCEINQDDKLWVLPGDPIENVQTTHGRTKNRRDHIVPLTDVAIDV
jgi:integrase